MRERTRLVNASSGGSYFGSDEEIGVGEKLQISISVPRSVSLALPWANLTGGATVVRVNRESPPPGKRLGIGVRFNRGLIFRPVGEWSFIVGSSPY